MRRVVALWLALALGSLPFAPGRALAEGEDEGFTFHPSIEVTNVVDSEPGLGRPGRKNEVDVGFWVHPRLELGYKRPDLELGADLGVDLRRYIERDRLKDELVDVRAFAEAGVLPGLSVRVAEALVPHYRQLGLPEDHGANLAQTNRVDAELRYWRELGSANELEIAAIGTHFLTEHFTAGFPSAGGPVFDPSYRADFWQTSGLAELSRPLGSHWVTHISGQAGFRDYREGARSDHMNAAVLVGLRSERLDDWEIELEAGYGLISFDTLSDAHQPLGRIWLRQRLPLGFAWTGLVANRFRSNMAGNEVFEATGELGLEKELGERADVSARIFVAHFEDRGAPSNLYGGVETELGYDVATQSRVSVTYRYWRNRGDAGFDDMTQNSLFLRFTLRR